MGTITGCTLTHRSARQEVMPTKQQAAGSTACAEAREKNSHGLGLRLLYRCWIPVLACTSFACWGLWPER